MSAERATPSPALVPPAGRTPAREILRLGDGYETSVYVHTPPPSASPDRKPVLFLHGIQSHPGWFYGTSLALADAGHTVLQVTRRGSGDNTVDRGHAESSRQLLEDIEEAAKFAAQRAAVKRIHLLGISWGGKLAAAYATWGGRGGPGIASLTMLAPGIVAKVSPGFFKKLGIAASILFNPKKLYDIPLSDPSLFTGNPAMLEYLRGDRYSLRKATAKLLLVSRSLDQRLDSVKRSALDIPVTLLLSTDDRIIDNEATTKAVERIAGVGLHTELLTGCHTLEFEQDPLPMYRRVREAVMRGE